MYLIHQESMEPVKTLLLFLILNIKGGYLLHKFNFEQQPENDCTKQRGSKHSFGSIVSQLTELEAPCPNKECKHTGKIPE